MKSVTIFVLNAFTNDSRVLKEAATLLSAGYSVKVVALHEGQLPKLENIDGLVLHRLVLRCRKLPSYTFLQILTYIELFLKVFLNHRDSDIYHCCDLISLPLGVALKKLRFKKPKVVYDAHEYEIETAGENRRKRNQLYKLERLLIKHADVTLTVSGSIADEYVRLYGIRRPLVILNVPRYKEHLPSSYFRDVFSISDKTPIFIYQGVLGSGRNISLLIEYFENTKNDCAIIFLGYGELSNEVQNAAKSSAKVYYHEAVGPNELHTYTSAADFGICLIEPKNQSYYLALPNKLFQFFMAGLPVIGSNFPEIESVIKEYSVGVVVPEQTIEGINEAVSQLVLSSPVEYEPGLKEVSKVYCWEVQEKKFLQAYDNL